MLNKGLVTAERRTALESPESPERSCYRWKTRGLRAPWGDRRGGSRVRRQALAFATAPASPSAHACHRPATSDNSSCEKQAAADTLFPSNPLRGQSNDLLCSKRSRQHSTAPRGRREPGRSAQAAGDATGPRSRASPRVCPSQPSSTQSEVGGHSPLGGDHVVAFSQVRGWSRLRETRSWMWASFLVSPSGRRGDEGSEAS